MTQASAPYAAGTAFIDGRYMPVAEAAAPAQQPVISIQMLLLAIFGALALAGLTGGVVYRFGRARHVARAAVRRPVIRQSADAARRPPWADMQPEGLAARHSDFVPRKYSADVQPTPAFAKDRV